MDFKLNVSTMIRDISTQVRVIYVYLLVYNFGFVMCVISMSWYNHNYFPRWQVHAKYYV